MPEGRGRGKDGTLTTMAESLDAGHAVCTGASARQHGNAVLVCPSDWTVWRTRGSIVSEVMAHEERRQPRRACGRACDGASSLWNQRER